MISKSFNLKRTHQCPKCPWRVTTNPRQIPGGYCQKKHAGLHKTIATPGEIDLRKPMHVMGCHHSLGNDDMYCVGWLHHQLGVGNNLPLRLKMSYCENLHLLKTYGIQHQRFEDTLPKPEISKI